jgi:methyltransferase (TIGR00027 family)
MEESEMLEKQESKTAKLCAFARAWHSIRADKKIFDDYLAYDIIGIEEYSEMYRLVQHGFGTQQFFSDEDTQALIQEYIAPIPLSRIHFTESRLHQFAEGNEKIQYVICGAGSDTFSFRNENPDIKIFEVDHPDTQRSKLEKIEKLGWTVPKNVQFVPVNFETESLAEKLLANGFDQGVKTFFSILGVSYYLTLPVLNETLKQIAQLSDNGSVLVFDYPQKSGSFPPRVERLRKITEQLGETMESGFDYGEISRALYSLGFQIDTYFPPEKIQEYYFADRSDDLRAFENVTLLSATYTGGYDYE